MYIVPEMLSASARNIITTSLHIHSMGAVVRFSNGQGLRQFFIFSALIFASNCVEDLYLP
jgi:hypothetical protein